MIWTAFKYLITFIAYTAFGYLVWEVHNDNVWIASGMVALVITACLGMAGGRLDGFAKRIDTIEKKHNQLIKRLEEDEQKLDELEDHSDDPGDPWS